jgi:hypothetical protein
MGSFSLCAQTCFATAATRLLFGGLLVLMSQVSVQVTRGRKNIIFFFAQSLGPLAQTLNWLENSGHTQ